MRSASLGRQTGGFQQRVGSDEWHLRGSGLRHQWRAPSVFRPGQYCECERMCQSPGVQPHLRRPATDHHFQQHQYAPGEFQLCVLVIWQLLDQ